MNLYIHSLLLFSLFFLSGCKELFRTIDASKNTAGGSPNTPLLRLVAPAYEDGKSTPVQTGLPSARAISNAVAAQGDALVPNQINASDYVWQWGQFLDHDIDLSPEAEPHESFPIPVPKGDRFFDPKGTGNKTIGFSRSQHVFVDGVREQVNVITAFIDGSQVYGSDTERANALRTLDGTGKLKTSKGNLLPFNTEGLPNAGGTSPKLFLAGDVRANEQTGLTALHTLFVREHNYWAQYFRALLPSADGNLLYDLARTIVTAELQKITYEEFLPVILGPSAIPPYRDYDRTVNPSIANEFSTAAFRFGHSMLSPQLLRLDRDLAPISHGHLPLKDAFFNPSRIINEGGIDPVLRGLAYQAAQDIDNLVVDAVRNFLFGPPGSGGFDLASLNIQRGRDHGLPRYNATREAFDLTPADTFDDICSEDCADKLATVYDNVDDIDLWVGGLAEPHEPNALVGELFQKIIADQFTRLRNADAFWFEKLKKYPQLWKLVEKTQLSHVIRRNTNIDKEIQANVFEVHQIPSK